MSYDILHYLTPSGRDTFEEWLRTLRDVRTVARILTRIDRLAAGNFGDCKPVGAGVRELRIDIGPGYRVYYAMAGRQIVLLLCGGDKRRQSADIAQAIGYFIDYKRRSGPS